MGCKIRLKCYKIYMSVTLNIAMLKQNLFNQIKHTTNIRIAYLNLLWGIRLLTQIANNVFLTLKTNKPVRTEALQ